MDDQEKAEWVNDLQTIKDLIDSINIRFDTVCKTGIKGSIRVEQAQTIHNTLQDVREQVNNLQNSIL